MPVLFVARCAEFVVGGLRAAFAVDAAGGTLLLADNRLDLQLSELHVCTQAEKAADAWHEADVAGEGDIAGLDELDDFVLFTVVFELEVLLVVVEGGLGVIVQVQVNVCQSSGYGSTTGTRLEFQGKECPGKVS